MIEELRRFLKERRRREKDQQEEEAEEQQQPKQKEAVREAEQEQGKRLRFGEEEQSEGIRAQGTDEREETSGPEEVRTGRGSAGLVRGEDEKRQASKTSRKGKGKGHGGKGEHEGKGGLGSKGAQQPTKMLREEDDEDERVQVAPNIGGKWLTPPGHVGSGGSGKGRGRGRSRKAAAQRRTAKPARTVDTKITEGMAE